MTSDRPHPPFAWKHSFRRLCLIMAGALLLLSLGGPLLGQLAASGASESEPPPVTMYVADRPGVLFIIFWVEPNRIVSTRISPVVKCQGGYQERGSITSSERILPLNSRDRFRRRELEAAEGSGIYFTSLTGVIRPNRVVGRYKGWEDRLGEEDEPSPPKCGTFGPDGRGVRFIARRVAGPPWSPDWN